MCVDWRRRERGLQGGRLLTYRTVGEQRVLLQNPKGVVILHTAVERWWWRQQGRGRVMGFRGWAGVGCLPDEGTLSIPSFQT